MKKLFALVLTFTSLATFADTITLKGGESIYIGGSVVKCQGGGSVGSGYAAYADLPWSQLQKLLEVGFGTCKIEYTQDRNPQGFYTSTRFRNLHVNNSSYGIIREDIRNGSCD